jgi:hypothetical protein
LDDIFRLLRTLKSLGVDIPPDLQRLADAELKAKTPEQEKSEEDKKFADQLLEQLVIRYEHPSKYVEVLLGLASKVIATMMNSAMSIDSMGPLAKALSVSAGYELWQYEVQKQNKNILGMVTNITKYLYESNPELEPQMRVTKEKMDAMNKLYHAKEGGKFGKEKAKEESYKD